MTVNRGTGSMAIHSLPVPPHQQLLTLFLLHLIWNILKIVDDRVVHLMEVHAIVFDTPGLRV
jgi:hypothetical protein